MKRFLFCESSKNFGGQEQQILLQMALLERAGHAAVLACPGNSAIAAEAGRRGLRWEPVAFRNSLHPPSLWAVRGILRRHGVTVAVCHSGHDADVLAVAARTVRPRPMLIRARTYQPGQARALPFNRLADRTVVPSEYLRRRILENPRVRASRVAVLPPLVPVAELRGQAARPLPESIAEWVGRRSPVIVHAAMLRTEKGHAFALSVIARLRQAFPNIGYVMAGAGSKEASLRRETARLGLEDSVLFAGLVIPSAPLLARADLVIMPSSKEPLGLAQLEALALGVPVAVSDAGGLPETVRNGETGWVLPAGETNAWVEGMHEALADPAAARRRAEAGRQWVEDQYGPETHLANFLGEIDMAMRSSRNRS